MNFYEYVDKQDKRRVAQVIKDWQHHKEDFFNYKYWQKRFKPFEDVFERNKPKVPTQLWRSERTDIDNKYNERFSSWSHSPDDINKFGWGERRTVTCTFQPSEILVDLTWLGLDTENMKEVIIKPGSYRIKQWKLVWDRSGFYNYYDEPERYDRFKQ